MDSEASRAGAGKQPRKLEKRKKRRSKRKQTTQKETDLKPEANENDEKSLELANISPSAESDIHEQPLERSMPIFSQTVDLSPRKKALMRHKTSNESISEPSFVSEVKQIKRNRKPVASADVVDGKYSLILSNQSMEEKTSLFTYPSAKIVSFQEQLSESPSRLSTGTLLAHGELEIFQLHGGDVTYLACGKSFVYPLLPKLKILRTSTSEFVLPLVNPQRYWKIHIDTSKQHVLSDLETVLKDVVMYTNLASLGPPPLSASTEIEAFADTHAGHVPKEPFSSEKTPPHSVKMDQYTPFFNDIPESPPSVPVSPHQADLYRDPLVLSAPLPPVHHNADYDVSNDASNSLPSITSAVASFGLTNTIEFGNRDNQRDSKRDVLKDLAHPRPQVLANPYYLEKTPVQPNSRPNKSTHIFKQPSKPASESSSMDSLLDEYEETVSVSRSVQYNISRPPSRAASHISAAHSTARSAAAYLNRPQYSSHIDGDGVTSQPHRRVGAGSQIDGFPTTSLSRYDRQRQNSISGRSRQSSVSELYSSTSNWMEPGKAPHTKKLASSRSTYSLANNGSHLNGKTSLNETYREIYKSISQHNISQSLQDKSGSLRTPHKPVPSSQTGGIRSGQNKPQSVGQPKLHRSQNFSLNNGVSNGSKRDASTTSRTTRNDGLSSVEVFKLLSERDNCHEKTPPTTGLRRLFGW